MPSFFHMFTWIHINVECIYKAMYTYLTLDVGFLESAKICCWILSGGVYINCIKLVLISFLKLVRKIHWQKILKFLNDNQNTDFKIKGVMENILVQLWRFLLLDCFIGLTKLRTTHVFFFCLFILFCFVLNVVLMLVCLLILCLYHPALHQNPNPTPSYTLVFFLQTSDIYVG